MSNSRKKLRTGFGFIIVGLVVLYGLFQARHLLEGPIVVILEPANGATLTHDLVTVRGTARNIAYIRLNDRQIFVDDTGAFSEKLIAPAGYSIIKIWAEDKFGKTEVQFIHLFLEESAIPFPSAIDTLESEEEEMAESRATTTEEMLPGESATTSPNPSSL